MEKTSELSGKCEIYFRHSKIHSEESSDTYKRVPIETWKSTVGRKVIHVAGTNGKGSVCAYIQALLLAEKKRTGFFSSPHLVKINERIRINGEEIDDEHFLLFFRK